MTPFKKYIVKEYTETGAVFHREIEIAAKEDYIKAVEGTPPDLSNTITTKHLVKVLNKDKTLGKIFKAAAAASGAQVFHKPSLIERLKGLFQ